MPTFLIADDSRDKIVMLKHMLKVSRWSGDILVAETTEQAQDLIDAHPDIAAAFIDYYIPSENGPAIIGYLRSRCPESRIALVSSADNAANTARALSAGAEIAICTTHRSDVVEKTIVDLLETWKSAA